MPKLKPETILPTPEEDEAITKAAMEDPDNPPLTDAEWAQVKAKRGRGRPAGSGIKEQVTLRLDRDLLEAFREGGEGRGQTRLNDALRRWSVEHGQDQATGVKNPALGGIF